MKKITKRIFSAILSAIMLILALPLTGFASDKIYTYKYEYIEFGSYPQSQVKDSVLISKLDSVNKNWVSYNYYSGEGDYGTMKSGDWMKYADFKYNGSKYRAVTFSQYRPYATTVASSEENSHQYDNGYYINNVYYFLYEPLKWRALTFQSDGVYLICDSIIDSQPFSSEVFHYYYSEGVGHHYLYNRQVEDCKNRENYKYLADNYETSSIKKWIDENFGNVAFNKSQRSKIKEIKLEESMLKSKWDYLDNFADTDHFLDNKISECSEYSLSQGLFVKSSSYNWWSGLAVDTEYEMSGYYANINIMNNKRLRMYNFYHQAVVPYDSSIGVRPVIFYKGITENKLGTVKATLSSSTVYLGETATVRVTVNSSPEKLRFVNRYNDSYTVTIDRNNIRVKSIEKYSDNTEVWYVNLNVNADSITYDVYAKYSGRGWYMIQYPCSFILEAQERIPDKDVYSFSIDECYDDVMYAGVHTVTVETGVDATKVQFYKDGNTWTYSADNASYVIEDDKKVWSINMNFSELGEDMEYYIRTRSQKSAFEFTDQVMNVWVRFK